MPKTKKAARSMLERAAVLIYAHVQANEITGIIKPEFDADCEACLLLKKLAEKIK